MTDSRQADEMPQTPLPRLEGDVTPGEKQKGHAALCLVIIGAPLVGIGLFLPLSLFLPGQLFIRLFSDIEGMWSLTLFVVGAGLALVAGGGILAAVSKTAEARLAWFLGKAFFVVFALVRILFSLWLERQPS